MREKYQGSQGTCNANEKNSPSILAMWAGGGEDSPLGKKEKSAKMKEKKRKENIGQNRQMDVLAVKERAPNQIDASCITFSFSQHRLPACRVDAPPHASRRSTQFTAEATCT
ncbi:uncharacterized protein TrAtP1_010351 [Trichoderma atroviride]|uniref:uncharacterized protein n=1 Tax=Hypocrea atroviridis TaxID=63577 RepID=UPI00331E7A21|nr:hypothetical protein TrAtP1_010351 [Trichoderma atroviride]